jgi:hypothetical protein
MFGKKKKVGRSKTSTKKNTNDSLSQALSLTPEKLMEILETAPLPAEIKQALIQELPEFIETIDETARKIYDPQQIWLESIQYADYVEQMADHLKEDHGDECRLDIAEQLKAMSLGWKTMAENAMRVLDESEGTLEFKHA